MSLWIFITTVNHTAMDPVHEYFTAEIEISIQIGNSKLRGIFFFMVEGALKI